MSNTSATHSLQGEKELKDSLRDWWLKIIWKISGSFCPTHFFRTAPLFSKLFLIYTVVLRVESTFRDISVFPQTNLKSAWADISFEVESFLHLSKSQKEHQDMHLNSFDFAAVLKGI